MVSSLGMVTIGKDLGQSCWEDVRSSTPETVKDEPFSSAGQKIHE